MINILHVRTEDDLWLQGVEYEPSNKALCVLMIHGMAGNFIENYFASVLGEKLSCAGFGFVYGHNRGYNHINDIATSKIKLEGGYVTKRIGTTYEMFTECLFDIDSWLEKCRELGYKQIVLMGHSLGCNKVIYYLSQRKVNDLVGVVLASPPDMVGLIRKPEYQDNWKELYQEAEENIKNNEPKKILSGVIWGWYHLSSRTFLTLFTENSPVDNLPIMRNPERWEQLEAIKVPILGLMGEKDDIAIKTLEEDLRLISEKATSCPAFTKKFIKGASHTYDGVEKDLARLLLKWLRDINK